MRAGLARIRVDAAARLSLWVALALTVGGSLGCSPDAGRSSGGPNVLLVVVDTLRADRLGCYGNPRGLTPRLDALAADGVLFEEASAHAPWTLPSTASLLTGRLPAQHGAGGRLGAFTRLSKGVPTLAGHFKRAGYATGAVVNVSFLGRDFGLAKGFEHHDLEAFESNREVRRAEATTDAALAWVRSDRGGRPFFLLAHYFDPHAVYDPPQPYRRRFALGPDREDESFVFGTREHMMALRAGGLGLKPEVIARAQALYDGEVAYTDAHVGRLLDGLGDLGVLEDTLVAVTSDHGEEFLDHDGFEHGHTLYRELVHVPLIFRGPGLEAQRFSGGVGLVDVSATLCELAGLEPLEGSAGRSLLGLLGQDRGRDVLAHGNFWGPPLSSWRTDQEKLIRNAPGAARTFELYRWREDRGERDDRAAAEPERVAALREELAAAEAGLAGPDGEAVELDEQRRRELESLGYMGGAEDG